MPVIAQDNSFFLTFVDSLNLIAEEERNLQFEKFLEKQDQLPIIESDRVFFIARAQYGKAPLLLADFNGFLHPRYMNQPELGAMLAIPGTRWHYRSVSLLPKARIAYRIKVGEQVFTDPLNPRVVLAFRQLYSEVRMPDYEIAPEIISDQSIPRGHLIALTLKSEKLQQERNVQIYTPPGYDKKKTYPSVYFHDGTFQIEEGRTPQILDYLIVMGKIQPLIAVFDDPQVRGREYRGDPDYIAYVSEELIPYVDEHYATKAEAESRAVIGFSRAGQSALYLSHTLDQFDLCGIFSPAIIPGDSQEFVQELRSRPHKPKALFMVGTIYDGIWYPDSEALKKTFQQEEFNFQYVEIPEGHNIPAWRTELDTMLEFFFPVEKN